MDDEFKLCWKNFQDNIASGFQNLYDRGDLVDVTLACDGKLLHAHKIVLAICSPYFQEMFITNPCKHPIIILKDVTFNIMCELLEFMYQGVVNVKHTELQTFMKIGQLLQIKGLATNSSPSTGSSSSEKSANQVQNAEDASNACKDASSGANTKEITAEHESAANAESSSNNKAANSSIAVTRSQTPTSSPSPMGFASLNQQNFKSSNDSNATPLHNNYHGSSALKRHSDFGSETLSIYSRKQFRRSAPASEHNSEHNDGTEAGMEQVNPEDFFLSSIPHISMVESRYDLNNVKRESEHHGSGSSAAVASIRNTFGSTFGFDYNLYKNSSANSGAGGGNANNSTEYPNELHAPNDFKNFGNHMDIPAIAPGEHWWQGKLEFMLSQRGKPLLVHDGHTFGIQYVRKDKKYWQCNLSRKFNCKARVTTTDTGEIIVTNNEHCHTEIRQHLRKDYQRNKVMMNALINLSTNRLAESLRRQNAAASAGMGTLGNLQSIVAQSTAGANLSIRAAPSTIGNSGEQPSGLLDLGNKIGAGVASGVVVPMMQGDPRDSMMQLKPQLMPGEDDDDDDDLPLDCGIRSTSIGQENNKRAHEANRESSGNFVENEWKCKDENSES